jgi:hypothetical protein
MGGKQYPLTDWKYQISRYGVRYLTCCALTDLNLVTGCGTAQCRKIFKLKKKFSVHIVHYQMYYKRPTICTDCTTPLFYVFTPTCFGSSRPSSGSFLDPPDLLEIQIEWVVYHILCGYVTCVPDCNPAHRSRNHNIYGNIETLLFKINWPTLNFRIIHLAHDNFNLRPLLQPHCHCQGIHYLVRVLSYG